MSCSRVERLDAELVRQFRHRIEGQVSLTALDRAEIGPVVAWIEYMDDSDSTLRRHLERRGRSPNHIRTDEEDDLDVFRDIEIARLNILEASQSLSWVHDGSSRAQHRQRISCRVRPSIDDPGTCLATTRLRRSGPRQPPRRRAQIGALLAGSRRPVNPAELCVFAKCPGRYRGLSKDHRDPAPYLSGTSLVCPDTAAWRAFRQQFVRSFRQLDLSAGSHPVTDTLPGSPSAAEYLDATGPLKTLQEGLG